MLTEVTIRGFKTLREPTTLQLSPVTVLVGPNNSGKSNVLAALDLLGGIARHGSLPEAIGSPERIAPRGLELASFPISIEVKAAFSPFYFEYVVARDNELLKARGGSLNLDIARINGSFSLPGGGSIQGPPGSGLRAWGRNPSAPEPIRAFFRFLEGIRLVAPSLSAMRAPSLITANPRLEQDGTMLASFLDWLEAWHPQLREAINEEVGLAAKDVARIVTVPAQQDGWKVVGIQEVSGHVYTADQISDGLLFFIGLTTACITGATLLGMEEPETGIHPRRLTELLDQVRRVANRGSQFVLTTHSPTLLNEFRDTPGAVLIVEREGDQSRVSRLSDRADIENQLRDTSLGDLWYSGVLGGVPAKLAK